MENMLVLVYFSLLSLLVAILLAEVYFKNRHLVHMQLPSRETCHRCKLALSFFRDTAYGQLLMLLLCALKKKKVQGEGRQRSSQ